MRRRHRTAYASLQSALALLEAAEQDMCAVEFIVESGALRVIDVRTGTSSGRASIRIAVDLVDAGLLGIDDALARITPASLRIAQQPVPKRDHTLEAALRGTPASPGTTAGEAALSAEQVVSCGARGGRPILLQERGVRYDASTIAMCAGVVSADGGAAAQPVVLARMLGIPAISHSAVGPAGSSAAPLKDESELPTRARIAAGEPLVLDADRGVLYRGATDLVAAQPDTYIARVLTWCVDHQRVPVLMSPPAQHIKLSELKAGGALPSGGTPVVIDVSGAGEDARSRRAVQVKEALRDGPRELVLGWSDDLEHEDGRIPVAPWTMIVAPDDRTWAAQLVATRLPLDTAALASITTEGAMT
jgi:phosphohistidine swiveling domain-containing protein